MARHDFRPALVEAEWGAPGEIMPVPPARPGSLENHLHQLARELGKPSLLLLWDELNAARRAPLNEMIGHRAIGVRSRARARWQLRADATRRSLRRDALL